MTEGRRPSWPDVSGYRISADLGRGGFASVYEAVQLSVGRRVALKVLSAPTSDSDMERRFKSECRTIGELSWHPHVVAVFDAGLAMDGRPYMAMELLPGGSLADVIRLSGPMDPVEVIRVGVEIADALSAAHDAGVIHRDVKPANILIGRRGEYVLSDFGIATISDATQSATGSFSGTYGYCAPEVHRGERAGPQADVFALGATLYTLLSGRSAFMTRTDDSASAVILRVVSEPAPPLPSSTPPALVAVIEQALSKHPSDRQRNAAEFRNALRAAGAADNKPDPPSPSAVRAVPPTVVVPAPPPFRPDRQPSRPSAVTNPPKGVFMTGIVMLVLSCGSCGYAGFSFGGLLGEVASIEDTNTVPLGSPARFTASSNVAEILTSSESAMCDVSDSGGGGVPLATPTEYMTGTVDTADGVSLGFRYSFEAEPSQTYEVICRNEPEDDSGEFVVVPSPNLGGAIWFVVGLGVGFLLFVVGLVLLIAGLVQRSNWKKNDRSSLPQGGGRTPSVSGQLSGGYAQRPPVAGCTPPITPPGQTPRPRNPPPGNTPPPFGS